MSFDRMKDKLERTALMINKHPTAQENRHKRLVLLELEGQYTSLKNLSPQLRRWMTDVVVGIRPMSGDLLYNAVRGIPTKKLLRLANPDASRWPFYKSMRHEKIGWDISDLHLYRDCRAARALKFLIKRVDNKDVHRVLTALANVRIAISSMSILERRDVADFILGIDEISQNDLGDVAFGRWTKFADWSSVPWLEDDSKYPPHPDFPPLPTEGELERAIREPVGKNARSRRFRTGLAVG